MELETFGEFRKGKAGFVFHMYGTGQYYIDDSDLCQLRNSLKQKHVCREPYQVYDEKTDTSAGSLYPANDLEHIRYNLSIDGITYSIRATHLLNVITGNQNAGEIKGYKAPELEPGQMTLAGVTA
jgi:hypothetical protein